MQTLLGDEIPRTSRGTTELRRGTTGESCGTTGESRGTTGESRGTTGENRALTNEARETAQIAQQTTIYTVSQLNAAVRFCLEESFPYVWIEGEVSNFASPHSGHWYFSLKDAQAQVRCAMFRTHQKKLGFTPQNGMLVLLKARVSLYENRGEFQLIVEFLEERGEGKLRVAFEQLKKKLSTAGLFAQEHKQTLPAFPKKIGVITSATGAAIRDILTVLKRRHPCVAIIIYPTLVQGNVAAANIVQAIEIANRRAECDVLILARGGGSLEDLWPFNEEKVAYAIHQSKIPLISGVGHEVDFTIADFVADMRAATPSAAAELAAPDCQELFKLKNRYAQQLKNTLQQKIHHLQQRMLWIEKHLRQTHPKRKITEKMQQLDFFELALVQFKKRLFQLHHNTLQHLSAELMQRNPQIIIHKFQEKLQHQQENFSHKIQFKLNTAQKNLAKIAATLHALSPLATLQRGYTVTSHANKIITRDDQVQVGDRVEIRLWQGLLECIVEKKLFSSPTE